MSEFSNVEDVNATLYAMVDCLNLTRGKGKDFLDHIAVKISRRAGSEQGPDNPWAANQGEYGKKKRKDGVPIGKGIGKSDDERMLELTQIKGRQVITPTEATMEFGTDEKMSKRGQWFTAGSVATEDAERSGAEGQPARPFYVMTDEDAEEILIMSGQAIAEFIGAK